MYEKLTKCSNFTQYLPEICPNFTLRFPEPKYFSGFFLAGAGATPCLGWAPGPPPAKSGPALLHAVAAA